MSSLAGALEEPVRYNHSYSALSSIAHEQDVDMETPDVKEEPNVVPVGMHRDGGDEPMDDLFGQEAEVDEPRQVKSETCAFMPPIIQSLVSILILCVYRSLVATPAESGYDSDELSQTEKERRRALEYMENDEPAPVVQEIQEANVSIPNIPIPRTSDGDVKIHPSVTPLDTHCCPSTG